MFEVVINRFVWCSLIVSPNSSSCNVFFLFLGKIKTPKNGYTKKQLTHFSITPLGTKPTIIFLTPSSHKFGMPKRMTPKSQAKLKPSVP